VPVLELVPERNGLARLVADSAVRPEVPGGFSGADDEALVLHTSGTTSRPRQVPLSDTSQARWSDRCLNVMPLFHVHGLVAGGLASLGAGGSTVCTGHFSAQQFVQTHERWWPTWYSAVPTMHQEILAGLRDTPRLPVGMSLRLIRSSSAALPPSVMAGLESAFDVSVIESYGMTEAAHQMTGNPLPPGVRKAGSVGLAAGPEVAILDDTGAIADNGRPGEVVIRGVNVTNGYVNHAAANASPFRNGWFRTGDQGYLDRDDYLFITGRLEELTNRGGEKIAPREIDEVLLCFPGVRQAVAFAVRHPSLGEDIAAAVVLEKGAVASDAELRAFAIDRLAAFNVPSRVVVVTEVPAGPTGKVQRIGLADRLADALAVRFESPGPGTEQMVAGRIGKVLGRSSVGRHDNFFELGDDSMSAAQVVGELEETPDVKIPVTTLFQYPTSALLAPQLERMREAALEALEADLAQLPDEERARLLDYLV
jgi:acyl-CoA synthetase (AMP-forming)/AMP-acid ligase II/acyl carrier protein